MASKHKANGNKLRRKTAKDFVGDERENPSYLDFVTDGEEIDSDLPVPNFSFSVASVVVCCVSVLCYLNSCKGEFVFDDSEAIVGNKDLKPDVPLGKLFLHDFWGANVAGLVGRADLLGALFFILSFLFYVRCCVIDYDEDGSNDKLPWKHLLLSMVFCSVAMLCKEQGITVLGVCCVYDVIVACQIDPLMLLTKFSSKENRNGDLKEKNEPSLWIKHLICRQVVLLLTGIVLLLGRWRIMGSSPPVFQVVDNPASFEESLIVR
ncbi:Protein O-mannosyl-transferase tmtc4, partial [Desmophyllum pertusum]